MMGRYGEIWGGQERAYRPLDCEQGLFDCVRAVVK